MKRNRYIPARPRSKELQNQGGGVSVKVGGSSSGSSDKIPAHTHEISDTNQLKTELEKRLLKSDVLASTAETVVSEENVYSALRAQKEDEKRLLKDTFDALFRYDATLDCLFVSKPIAVQGGVTMFADAGTLDLPSIYDGIPLGDGLEWRNGQIVVTVNGGLDEAALGSYLTTHKYATQNWVTSQLSSLHSHSNKSVLDAITTGKVSGWDSAYSHISDTTKHITAESRVNWNTAFGWGNHAVAGYALNSALSSHVSDAIKHITTAERNTWNAKENALGRPSVNGYLLSSTTAGVRSWVKPYELTKDEVVRVLKDADGCIRLDAHMLLSGGLTMLSSLGIDVPSIFDNAPIATPTSKGMLDNSILGTGLSWVSGKLTATATAGTFDHASLNNRNAANQHTIAAITGLQAALDAKSPTHSHPYRPDTWIPTAAQVGALGKTETAADSLKLGGKIAADYWNKANSNVKNVSWEASYLRAWLNRDWAAVIYSSGATNEAIFGVTTKTDQNNSLAYIRVGVNKLQWSPEASTQFDIWHDGNSGGRAPSKARRLTTENLNDIQVAGFYYQDANVNALATRNYPVNQQAGSLVVKMAAGLIQEYTLYGATSNSTFVRSYYGGTWSGWKKVFNSQTANNSTEDWKGKNITAYNALSLINGSIEGIYISYSTNNGGYIQLRNNAGANQSIIRGYSVEGLQAEFTAGGIRTVGEVMVNGAYRDNVHKLIVSGSTKSNYYRFGSQTSGFSSVGYIGCGTSANDNIYLVSSNDVTINAGGRTSGDIYIKSNGNVGLGISTGAYKLDVNGNTNTSSSYFIQKLRCVTSNGTDIFFGVLDAGNGHVVFRSNGAERIRLTKDGQFGIGATTITSGYKLQVNGASYFNDNIKVVKPTRDTNIHCSVAKTGSMFSFSDATIAESNGVIMGLNSDGHGYFWHRSANSLIFGTGGTQRMVLNGSGSLGIGTTSPSTRLQVDGSSSFNFNALFDFRLKRTGNGAGSFITFNPNNQIVTGWIAGGSTSGSFEIHNITNSTETTKRLVIKTNGYLGLGITDPNNMIHAVGNIQAQGGVFYRSDVAGFSWDNGNGVVTVDIDNNSAQTPLILARRTSNSTTAGRLYSLELLNNGTVLAHKMGGGTLFATHSSGMIGVNIGVSTPNATMQINGIGGRRVVRFQAPNIAGNSFGPLVIAGTNSNDSSFKIQNATDSATYLHVRGDGMVGIGTSSPSATLHVRGNILADGGITMLSDMRLKNRISNVKSVLPSISNIDVFRYTLKADVAKRIYIGVSAKQIQGIWSEFVHGVETLSLDYAQMAAYVAIKGLQETKLWMDSKDKKIAELEKRIVELEKNVA
ncbi:MAG: hypothetical protein ACRDCN_00095 [Tannerellaceae bacterium]